MTVTLCARKFWCAAPFDGELEFDAVNVEDEACEHVLAADFGLTKSQVFVPKVLFGSSRLFSEFSSAWCEVHWDFILENFRSSAQPLNSSQNLSA
jgi:hypothetical protein